MKRGTILKTFSVTANDFPTHKTPAGPFFQRKVAYNNLPDEVLPAFRKHSAKRAQILLESLDRWLAQRDRGVTPTVKGSGRSQAGIGVYYFEKPYSNMQN